MRPPLLTPQHSDYFEEQIKELIPSYLPQWRPQEGEVGWAVAKSFAEMSQEIATRLNQLPQKLFLSYLDRAGLEPKEGQPSWTPVSFKLRKKGSKSARVPINSQLMSQSKELFETQQEFTAMNSELISCYFVDPKRDMITDIYALLKAEGRASLDSMGESNRRELYIRDDKLFCFKKSYGERQKVTLRLPRNLPKEWFYWGEDHWIKLEPYEGKRHLFLKKKNPTPSQPREIEGESGYWLKASFPIELSSANLKDLSIRLTTISGLDCSFINDVAIDLDADAIYPFGEEPQLEDSWYLASSEAFSKSGHRVRLFWQSILDMIGEQSVTLSWEYNSGKSWQGLKESYHPDGVSFVVPNDIALFKHNDIESYWIRVRIVAGGYAQSRLNSAQVITNERLNDDNSKTITFDVTQSGLVTTYTPPKLRFKKITVKGVTDQFNHITTYSDLNYSRYDGFPLALFDSSASRQKSLYLGFDNPFESGMVSLFFALATRQIKIPRTIGLFYEQSGDVWQKLKIDDKTSALQSSGTVSFLAPSSQVISKRFDHLAYWIKIELIESYEAMDEKIIEPRDEKYFDIPIGDGDQGDQIEGIYLNTVWAKYIRGGEMGAEGRVYTLDKLISTIPAIKELSNPLPIAGGAKAESNRSFVQKAPARIRHRNRAINSVDIESLVYEVSSSIARVKLFLSPKSGANRIVVLPLLDDPMPRPSFALRQQIEEYLAPKLSALSSVEILAPEYVSVGVVATLHTKEVSYADRIEQDSISTLKRYLHPLHGRANQEGWGFGESPCLSDIMALLEHLDGVDYISKIELVMQSRENQIVLDDTNNRAITLPPYALIASGSHQIKVEEV